MKNQQLIMVLVLSAFLFCKKSELFIYPIAGAAFYEKADEKSKQLGRIPFNEIVKSQSSVKNNDLSTISSDGFTKIEYQAQTGYIKTENLRLEKLSLFYRIIPNAGLVLRERPDRKSSKLAVIPKNTIGDVMEVDKKLETINGRTGYWFKTKSSDKTGWIFSGYTVTSVDKDTLKLDDYTIKLKIDDVELSDKSIEEISKGGILKNEIDTVDYSVFSIKYKLPEDDCSSVSTRLVFKDKIKNKLYTRTELYTEDLIKANYPLENLIYTTTQGCNCCCPYVLNNAYFLTKTGFKRIWFEHTNEIAKCMTESTEFKVDNRINEGTKELMLYWQRPDCDSTRESQPEESKYFFETDIFRNDLFSIISYEDKELKIQSYNDQGIPEKFKYDWEKGKRLIFFK